MTALLPSGTESADRRSLLTQAVVFHAVRGELGRLCDLASHGDAVELALLTLRVWAREAAQLSADVEAAVTHVVKMWDASLSQMLDLHVLGDHEREVLGRVRRSLASVGSQDPFDGIFRIIVRLSKDLYGPAWRPAVLSLQHWRSDPTRRPGTNPYPISALTALIEDPPEATVTLHIYDAGFGPAVFAAVPACLTHECVCHVPARQDRVKNDSTFAEGLLDWAAYFFLDTWAMKLDIQFGPAIRDHARALRQVMENDLGSDASLARRIGHNAAESLRGWFEVHRPATSDEATALVARLAVKLNALPRSLDEKDNFVSMLAKSIPNWLGEKLLAWAVLDITTEELLDAVVAAR